MESRDDRFHLDNLGGRLLYLLKVNGVQQKELAKIACVSAPYISRLISNQVKINANVLLAVITIEPDLSLKWLLKGAGEMLHSDTLTADESEVLMMYRRLNNGEKCRQLESLRQTTIG